MNEPRTIEDITTGNDITSFGAEALKICNGHPYLHLMIITGAYSRVLLGVKPANRTENARERVLVRS